MGTFYTLEMGTLDTLTIPVRQHYISPTGPTYRVVVFPFGKALLAPSGQDALTAEDCPFDPFHCGTSLSCCRLLRLHIAVFSASLLEGIHPIWCCMYGLRSVSGRWI
jgi:hypothetical protein